MRARDRLRLKVLAYEVTVAEIRERARVASDLHDGLGQLLAIAQMRLDELEQSVDAAQALAQIAQLRSLIVEASAEARSVTFDLHSPVLKELGLQAAIEALGCRLARQGNTHVAIDGRIDAPGVHENVQAVLLRVVRELLLNIYKHARARHVSIRLSSTPRRLTICVADDGLGFDAPRLPRAFSPQGGFGLPSVEAQIRALGGRFDLQSACGRGTTATLSLNLQHHEPAPSCPSAA